MLRSILIITVLIVYFVSGYTYDSNDRYFNEIDFIRRDYGNRMLSYMDKNVDPCRDFYKYACGNFVKSEQLNDIYGIVNEEINKKLDRILMQPIYSRSDEELNIYNKVKHFYQSCIRMKYDKNSETFLNVVKSIIGISWPLFDNNNNNYNNNNEYEDHFDWYNITLSALSQGINTFLRFNINNNKKIISINSYFYLIRLNWQNIHYVSSKEYKITKNIFEKLLKIYGISDKNIYRTFNEIIEFGKRWKYESLSIGIKNLTLSYSHLDDTIFGMNLKNLLNIILNNNISQKNYEININNINDIEALVRLLNKSKYYYKPAINYIAIIILYNLHGELLYDNYETYCIDITKKSFSKIIPLIFINSNYYNISNENRIHTLMSYIRYSFKNLIKYNNWLLDKYVKRKIIDKINYMKLEINNFSLFNTKKHENELENVYKNLNITLLNKFPDNILELFRFKMIFYNNNNIYNYHKYLAQKHTKNLLNLRVYYYYIENKIYLDIGLLEHPIFYHELPQSYNFGKIGNILGHEMLHGFDATGINYNKYGDKINNWLSNKTNHQFMKISNCFMKQYHDFENSNTTKYKKHHNLKTLSENIADNGGIKIAFYGYQKWKSYNNLNSEYIDTIPNINLTDNQLFFISAAQLYCSSEKSSKKSREFGPRIHSEPRTRVIGSMSNFDEFGKAFNCKLGTAMNPVRKCSLW